jgi:predicted GNAT superfamily acetyltransferase
MSYALRDVTSEDLDAVLELNEQVVPAVNSIPIAQMSWFADNAAYFRVADAGGNIAAFLIGLRPGTTYDSLNYQWFCARYDDFAYIDRVAVAASARRAGLASRLYEDFRASLPESVGFMTCEVNLRPPNETSMKFHEGHEFRQVSSRVADNGAREVAMMVRTL